MPHRAFYNNNPTFPTSHFLGEWADLAAAVMFRFSMINAVNLVVSFSWIVQRAAAQLPGAPFYATA